MEPRVESRPHLAVDALVGLAEVLAALAVTEDDALAADLPKHRRAHFAGERALLLVVTVLREELDGGALQGLLHRRQRRKRGRDRDLRLRGHLLLQLPHELHRLGGGLVHLPVSADELATLHSSSTLIPGSSRPSRNSSEAPPPVETWVTLSASPISAIAAAESPPPTTVRVPRFVKQGERIKVHTETREFAGRA